MSMRSGLERFRSVLLNLPLFALFALAWVSDRWPNFVAPALVLAIGVVILEVLILVFISRKHHPEEMPASVSENSVSSGVSSTSQSDPVRDVVGIAATQRIIHHRALLIRNLSLQKGQATAVEARIRHYRPRASQVLLWEAANELSQADLTVTRTQVEWIAKRHAAVITKRTLQMPGQDRWKVIPQGEDAFTIDAGAFAIEHFGGQTNIRIHDPSRVTVEGSERGSAVSGLPQDVRMTRYN